VTPTQRKDVTRRIQERLGDRYDIGDEVGAGRFSLVFKAQQKKPSRTVAVKVFVASEFDDWAVKAFDEAVKRGANLTSGAFLKIIEVVDAPTPRHGIRECRAAVQVSAPVSEWRSAPDRAPNPA
jgi:serine/threonine protein kinase